MKNLVFVILMCFLIYLFPNTVNAQSVKVETTNLEIVDNKLIIDYSFKKSKGTQRFDVWVEVTKSTGEKINAQSFSGDIGSNLLGGENKKISWDYNKDGIILNEEINIEVFANITVFGPGMGKALLFSAALPGLGLSKLDPGKPYWIMGAVGYGLLAGSIYLNNEAVSEYDKYSYDYNQNVTSSDKLFESAESKDKLSKTLAYSAIGIWAGSLIWTAIKAKASTSSVTGNLNKKQKVFLYGGLNPKTKSAGFTLKYRF